MFLALITLLAGLSLACVAAAFAIFGIMAVFSGAPISALIMGAAIELGKVVGVSWLYRNWSEKTLLKWVMLPVVITAMSLTSLGIFGYLSKAHIEQNAPVANNELKIERLDQRIQSEQDIITDAEGVIAQLDDTVQTLIKFEKISGPDGARTVRAKQQEQRDELSRTITEAQDAIDKYEDQKLQLNQQLQDVELEVGPIRYVAELIYDDPKSNLENAVRMMILAFIFVFDPMAILLIMASNFTLMKRQREKKPSPVETVVMNVPVKDPDIETEKNVEEWMIEDVVLDTQDDSEVEEVMPDPEPEVIESEPEVVPEPEPEPPLTERSTITMNDLRRAKLDSINAEKADVKFIDVDRAPNTFGYYHNQDKPRTR